MDTQASPFLAPKQIEELTGYVQHAAQIRWLRTNGVVHYVRADGRPVVPLSALEQRQPAVPTRAGPDLDAVRVRH